MFETISYRIYLQQSPMTAWIFYLDYKPLTHIRKLVHIYILKDVSLAVQKPISQLWPECNLLLSRLTA